MESSMNAFDHARYAKYPAGAHSQPASEKPKSQGLLSRFSGWFNSRRLDPVTELWSSGPSFGEWKRS